MNLVIVRSNEDDAQLIASILNEAIQYKLHHQDKAWGSEAFTEQEIRKQQATSSTYIVYLNAEPVATFAMRWQDKRIWGDKEKGYAGYIHRLAIKDGFHGQHIGQEIMGWAREQTRLKGCKYMRLDCSPTNKKLCAYYEKLGFTQVGTHEFPSYTAGLYESRLTEGSK
jgi:ribosomal protein S18 acetylase RimI-like enzyme